MVFEFRFSDPAEINNGQLPHRHGSSLVQDDSSNSDHVLESFPSLDEDSVLGSDSGSDHDCCGGSESESTRASDDDDGDGEFEAGREVGDVLHLEEHGEGSGREEAVGEEHPGEEGDDGERDDHGDEEASDSIREFLDRGFGRLSVLDHLDDLSESCIASCSGDEDVHRSESVDGSSDNGVADLLNARERFSGHHRLVDARGSSDDGSIGWDLVSRDDLDVVSDLDEFRRDLLLDGAGRRVGVDGSGGGSESHEVGESG